MHDAGKYVLIAGKIYELQELADPDQLQLGLDAQTPPAAAPEFDPLSDPLDEPFREERY